MYNSKSFSKCNLQVEHRAMTTICDVREKEKKTPLKVFSRNGQDKPNITMQPAYETNVLKKRGNGHSLRRLDEKTRRILL